MSSYQELCAQAERLRKEAEALRREEIKTVIADIRAKMSEYGITIDDLRATTAKSPRKGYTVAPKYRNSHGQTWSGRGKKPRWLQQALAAGASLESFRIAGS